MNQIIINKMTKEDLEDVCAICKDSFPIPWTISSFENELKNLLATYLVAKLNEKTVGYIGMWIYMDECNIINIAVHKDYRRQGIASILIEEMLKLCKKHKTRYIMLEVRANNIPAQKLYAKHGFRDEIIRKNYYANPDGTREDALIMSLEM